MFRHISRKGVVYYVHGYISRGGRTRYTLKRNAEGALAELPPGYEVVENVNGQTSVRRARARQITGDEEALVRSSLERHSLDEYRVEIKGRWITIFEPDRDPVDIAAQFDPLSTLPAGIGERVKAMVREQLGDAALEQYIRERQDKMRAAIEQTTRYAPVLRFELADKERRLFTVARMTYRGKGGWHALDLMPLAEALERYVQHLGKDSFFELI